MNRSLKILLLLDYDGTLVPIKKHPKLARLSPQRKTFLRKLANHPGIKMAIISGRKLSDIKKLVTVPGLIYVGNHGLEMEIAGRRIIYPAVNRFVPTLKKIKAALSAAHRIKGVLVEDKGYTLSVHFRLLPADRLKTFHRLFLQAMRRWRAKVRITSGKKVIEIRPPVDWDKGKAIKWVINKLRLGDYWPVYIGDDKTDEDAFRALKEKGMTIHVGGGKTLANMRVKNIGGVYRYLRSLFKDES